MIMRNCTINLWRSGCGKSRSPMALLIGQWSMSVNSPPMVTCFLTPLVKTAKSDLSRASCALVDERKCSAVLRSLATSVRRLSCTKNDKLEYRAVVLTHPDEQMHFDQLVFKIYLSLAEIWKNDVGVTGKWDQIYWENLRSSAAIFQQ